VLYPKGHERRKIVSAVVGPVYINLYPESFLAQTTLEIN